MIIANWKCNGSTEMILSWFEAYNIEFDFENYDFDIFIGLALPSIYLNYFDREDSQFNFAEWGFIFFFVYLIATILKIRSG